MQSPEDRFNQLWVISDIDEIETMPDKNSKTMRKHCVLQNHLKHAGKGQLISSQIETLKTEKNALCDDLPVSEKSQGLLRAVSDSPHVRVQKISLHYLLERQGYFIQQRRVRRKGSSKKAKTAKAK
uniref:Uncharacterized protein n=1 Tax=Fibrocapsa japonica TaxID=94617 RepID=A0A7S2V0M1_9STRA|mmetsp:Transcript_20139/g.29120  ORF Transcript_20139/g.29120 Transcript_20139/m.29120 type:complete len:126 (+) Transcript_20139:70-447(+)